MKSSVLNLLRKRRSIRKFTSQPVEDEKVDALVETAIRTPTSRGRNPWEFIVLRDKLSLEKISRAKEHGSAFLAGAPLAIVIAADTGKSDVWTEDCSIAAIAIQLAAEELGLGSCWVQIRLRQHDANHTSEDYLKDLLGLPANFAVECIIGIGYPGETKSGHAKEFLPFDQVHYEKFD